MPSLPNEIRPERIRLIAGQSERHRLSGNRIPATQSEPSWILVGLRHAAIVWQVQCECKCLMRRSEHFQRIDRCCCIRESRAIARRSDRYDRQGWRFAGRWCNNRRIALVRCGRAGVIRRRDLRSERFGRRRLRNRLAEMIESQLDLGARNCHRWRFSGEPLPVAERTKLDATRLNRLPIFEPNDPQGRRP